MQLDIRCPNYLILSIDAFILNQELPSNLINKRTDIMRLNSNQFQFLGTNKIGPRRGVSPLFLVILATFSNNPVSSSYVLDRC